MPQLTYAPMYLVPQCVEKNDGIGPLIDLGTLGGKLLVVTLGINDVVEQEALAISIWGSSSGTDWGPKPLLTFPQKSYCGAYATILNLTKNPAVRFLRVQWTMSRWTQRNSDLMFGFYVSLEEVHSEVSSAVA
jgi:hypothetical protein